METRDTDDLPTDDAPAPPAGPLDVEGLVRKFQKELNSGLIALVLLSVLERAEEDLYGYQIAKRLQGMSDGGSPMKQGALYPVLRTLSAHGLLASRVVPSYAGPPRRYYRITEAGRDTLARWLSVWTSTRNFVDAVAQPARDVAATESERP
ncbi:MAG TPA: PadR family transcriptional regulator [Steroidobacteraceae bacterium]|nr:PadR family transcriptional regulator [Steroidobacteraceae bacterium]